MSSEQHYAHYYGHRGLSGWGQGPDLAPWAEGDIVLIPEGAKAFNGRIPHSWSIAPYLNRPGHYRVISSYSIGEESDWYFRVCPIVNGRTEWDEVSDRLHVYEKGEDWTSDWILVRMAKPRQAE